MHIIVRQLPRAESLLKFAVVSVFVTDEWVVIALWVKSPSRHRWSGSGSVMQVVMVFKIICCVSISGDHVGE